MKRGMGLAMSAVVCGVSSGAAGAKLTPVPFTDVVVADEFWAPRIKINAEKTIPHNFKMCEETGRIANLAKAAGLMEGDYQGYRFNDSDVFKLLEGACSPSHCRGRVVPSRPSISFSTESWHLRSPATAS